MEEDQDFKDISFEERCILTLNQKKKNHENLITYHQQEISKIDKQIEIYMTKTKGGGKRDV